MDEKEKKYELIQNTIDKKNRSRSANYTELFVGKKGFFAFLKYEILTSMFANCPGAAGIFLRSLCYRSLFKKFGKGVVIGRNVSIRNPNKISVGNKVIIDENVLLDAKGIDNEGITIGNGVYLGRNSILSCKNGDIILKDSVNIGFNCEIVSLKRVEVGENTLFAAYTYVVGGGHIPLELDTPLKDQPTHGIGIKIGKNAWLGAKSIVMDGCDVGEGSIVGAGAIVTENIPDFVVAVGIPAKVIRKRKEEKK